MWIAMARVLLDDHESAILAARECLQRQPENLDAWIVLANSLSLEDRIEEAQECIERARAIAPHFSPRLAEERFQAIFEREGDAARLTAGLRKAEFA